MRNLLILPVIIACLLSTGCSTTEDSVYLTPVTQATLAAYKYEVGAPIDNKLDAVIVARFAMEGGSRIESVGDPQVGYAEQSNLAEASQELGYNPAAFNPDNMLVWLVIFEGEWQLVPIPNEQGNIVISDPPFHGCKFSLIRSSDGLNLAPNDNDVTCPSKIK